MVIRQEKKEDVDTVYNLIKEAFATAQMSDGTEQDFANKLRESEKFIPQLALVAEEKGEIIGHIMLTKLCVQTSEGDKEALLLAPISVKLENRGKGVGKTLIKKSLERAKELGYKAVFLAGNPGYYSRFGFQPTIKYNITHKKLEVEDKFVMCMPLEEGYLDNLVGDVHLV